MGRLRGYLHELLLYFSQNWRRVLKVFLSTIGALSIVPPFLKYFIWNASPSAEVAATICNIAVAATFTASFELWFIREFRSLRRFFGVVGAQQLILAFPTWVPIKGQTLGKYNYENGKFETRQTRTEPATHQINIDMILNDVAHRSAFASLNPLYMLDESLFSSIHNEPRFLHQYSGSDNIDQIAVVSSGASSSNHLCRFVLKEPVLRKNPYVYHFLSEFDTNLGETDYFLGRIDFKLKPDDGLPERFEVDKASDYALLVKLTVTRAFIGNRQKKLVIFVCAGLDGAGSRATLNYLIRNWKRLRSENRYNDFYYLLKVSQETHEIEGLPILHGIRKQGQSEFSFSKT